jgi:hypothetical protein
MDDADRDFLEEGERVFLLALNRLGVRYLLVGMSAALLQGARGATEDIDIWFESTGDPRIGEAAREAGGFWVTRTQPPMLGGAIGERFDIVVLMSGLPDFGREYAGAVSEKVSGVDVKVLPLGRILHSKLTARRPKDVPGIHQIQLAIAVMEELKGK